MTTLEQRRELYIEERKQLAEAKKAEIDRKVALYKDQLMREILPEFERLDTMIKKIDELIALENTFCTAEEESQVEPEETVSEEAQEEQESCVEAPVQNVEPICEQKQCEQKDTFDVLKEDLHAVRTVLDQASRPGMNQVCSPRRF